MGINKKVFVYEDSKAVVFWTEMNSRKKLLPGEK